MKVQIGSDLHMEAMRGYSYSLPIVKDRDLLILAGDIDNGPPREDFILPQLAASDVIMVAGNHEGYGEDFQDFLQGDWVFDINAKAKRLNLWGRLHFLENDSRMINQVQFVGCTLWTSFYAAPLDEYYAARMMSDYMCIFWERYQSRFTTDICKRLNARSFSYLKQFPDVRPRKKVFITHHAPSKMSNKPYLERVGESPIAAAFCNDYDKWLASEKNTPDLWIHGHTHDPVDYTIGKTRVVCNPKGYPGESTSNTWEPTLCLEI